MQPDIEFFQRLIQVANQCVAEGKITQEQAFVGLLSAAEVIGRGAGMTRADVANRLRMNAGAVEAGLTPEVIGKA